MALIDTSYFIGEITVPNIGSVSGNPAASINLAELNRLILIYEKDYLVKLLGKALYDVFIANPSADWVVSLTAQLKDTTNKISPIAYYVWHWWKRNNASMTSEMGEFAAKSENASTNSNIMKQITGFNTCVSLTCDVLDWMDENSTIFPSAPETDLYAFRPINDFGI